MPYSYGRTGFCHAGDTALTRSRGEKGACEMAV